MKRVVQVVLLVIIFLLLITLFTLLTRNGNLQLLNPQGFVANMQSEILFGALVLAACIGIPVVAVTFFIAFHYREGNKKAKYSPDWTSGNRLLFAWWAFPAAIILILSCVTWYTAHALDPYKPIVSTSPPIIVQVVALRWKWLFIYPKEKIATVNFLEIPVNTPVNFQLTADAPMNSFWIPSLGGQIYAMAGMVTQLHLVSSTTGEFPGGPAEMSGEGFSGMTFPVESVSQSDYNAWVQTVRTTGKILNLSTYNQLAKPSANTPKTYYSYQDETLYNQIVMKFMMPSMTPGDHMNGSMNMSGMGM